jgi:hypothetical protein
LCFKSGGKTFTLNQNKSLLIIQPSYIPWIGFFSMLNLVHSVIFLDDVQFDKGGWRNRNRVRNLDGPLWLSVPINQHMLMNKMISEVKIADNNFWRKKHIQSLKLNYPKASPELLINITEIIENASNSLIELNLSLINFISKYLNIEMKSSFSSSYHVNRDQNKRLVELCKSTNSNIYLSGPAARSYLRVEIFESADIKVNWFEFDEKKEYPQRGKDFIPYLSILDVILNNSQSIAESYVKSQFNVSS